MQKVTSIQNPEWLPKKLGAAVSAFNLDLAKLNEREASLPTRRRELGLSIIQGTIDPSEAVKVESELATEQRRVDMLYAALHIRKLTFRADLEAARHAEQVRAQALAEALKLKAEEAVAGIGNAVTRAQIVAADHAVSEAVAKARALVGITLATPPVEEGQWFDQWAVAVKRTFGIPL